MNSIFNIRFGLLLLAFLMPLCVIFALEFNGLYGQDGYAYLQMSIDIDLFHTEAAKEFFWPIIFPLFGKLLQYIIPNHALALQLISLTAFALSAVLLFDIICNLFDASKKWVASFVLLFFVFSPYIFRFSMLVMSDMLCLLFVLITVKYSIIKEVSSKNVIFVSIAAVLAVSTRYVAIVIICVPVIYLYFKSIGQGKYKNLVMGLFFALLAFLPHLYFKGLSPYGLFDNDLLQDWSVLNSFKKEFIVSNSTVYNFSYLNLISTFLHLVGPAFCVFASILLMTATYMKIKSIRYTINTIILATFILYFVFINGIPFQNNRYYIIAFPLFLILTFPAYQFIVQKKEQWRFLAFIGLLVTQLFLIYQATNSPMVLSKRDNDMAGRIGAFNQKDLPIYTSGLEGPIGYYLPESPLFGLYRDSVKSFESNFILVIDSQRAMSQKPNSNLVKNLNQIYGGFAIEKREKLQKNWIIYEFRR